MLEITSLNSVNNPFMPLIYMSMLLGYKVMNVVQSSPFKPHLIITQI